MEIVKYVLHTFRQFLESLLIYIIILSESDHINQTQ